MEDSVLLENGQSAQLIVEKDNRPEKEAVITQPHLMVVMIVKEVWKKRKIATPALVQVR